MIEFKGKVSKEVIDYAKSLNKYSVKSLLLFFIIMEICMLLIADWFFLSEEINIVNILVIDAAFLLIFIIMDVIAVYKHLHPSDYETGRMVTKRLYIDYEDRSLYFETEAFPINMVGLEKVKKVIDYGSFYQICIGKEGDDWKKYICQKDLLVKGSIKDFERIFKKKLVRADEVCGEDKNYKNSADLSKKDSEPLIVETKVVIMGMRCGIKKSGYRIPKTERGYFVTVVDPDGKTTEYRVDEKFYTSVFEGQTVCMLTRENEFLGLIIDRDEGENK